MKEARIKLGQVKSGQVKLGQVNLADMEKVSILPRTRFVKNLNFRKKTYQNCAKNLEILWKSLFIIYNFAKYLIFFPIYKVSLQNKSK